MADEFPITPTRGGNRHPLSVTGFILGHLAAVGEDYISSMHRAYKAALDRTAVENHRRYAYHKPRYHSFEMKVQQLVREGQIEFSGREEESDAPQFAGWTNIPVRRFFKLIPQ